MAEEAIMICIDNSEWMRNGDYPDNRFDAQHWGFISICGAINLSNPENTVGALTMAGKGVRVLITPTSDFGEQLSCICGLSIGGEMNLAAGLQVAQLALKHRQNKKQQQRIILFAGSPVKEDKRVLEMIGRKLKKHSIALDVINFGQEDAKKAQKLEALVAAVNNSDNSHIIHIPPGTSCLSDVLMRRDIFTRGVKSGDGFSAVTAGAGPGYDFGVDPNLDPELALALRVSMEEEWARQAAAAKKAAQEAAKQEKGEMQSTSQDVTMTENVSARSSETENKAADLLDNDLARLQQALAMSRDDSFSSIATRDSDMSEADFEDQELLLALQLSVQDNSKVETTVTKLLADQSFMSSIFGSLPGVSPNYRPIEDSLAFMQSQSEQNDENKEQQEDKEQREDKK